MTGEAWASNTVPAGPSECYRCWQIGKRGVPADLVVRYNAGTPHEFTRPSCAQCYADDVERFPARTLSLPWFASRATVRASGVEVGS